MKRCILLISLLVARLSLAETPPNILFILCDDLGTGDVRLLNPEGKIATPNMDRIGREGMIFTDAHTPSSVCTPTRYGTLTGRYNWRTKLQKGVLGGLSPRLIEEGRMTVASMLKEKGYHTAAVGKWHLANMADYVTGGSRDHWPLGKGFNRWYGFLGGFIDHWNPDLHEDNHPVQRVPREYYHLTEDLVDHAIEFVRDHVTSTSARPWLTYLALGAGHLDAVADLEPDCV